MAEVIHLEGSDCIGAHNQESYENPNSKHNRHDGHRNMRIQISEVELDLLLNENGIIANAYQYGTEKHLGNPWIIGCNGELGKREIAFKDRLYFLSGKLCEKLKKRGYVETTCSRGDISILVTKN